MRRAFFALAAASLLVACGGSSPTERATQASDETTTTTTAAAVQTTATTAVDRTTEAATTQPGTTKAPAPSTTLPALLPAASDLPAPVAEGWTFVPADLPTTSLTWLATAEPADGLFTGAAAFSARGHAGGADLVLLRVDPARVGDGAESAVDEAIAGRAAAAGRAPQSTVERVSVQRTVGDSSAARPWVAWYHDGLVVAAASWSGATLDDLAQKLVEAEHLHPAYTTGGEAEGDLPGVFPTLSLPRGCEIVNTGLSDQDRIEYATSWGEDPMVQHSAVRAVLCGGKLVALLTILDLHPEFVTGGDIEAALEVTGVPGATVDHVGDVPFVPAEHGLLWYQDGDFYLLQNPQPDADVATMAAIMASIAHVQA